MKRRLAWIAALIAELISALIATRWTLAPEVSRHQLHVPSVR